MTSTSNTAVAWRASAGTISPNGLFTAPQVSSATKVTVTATSAADNSVSASADVSVAPPVKLSMQAAKLPEGTVGSPYTSNLSASGGVSPYRYQITSGTLPEGLSLNHTSGLISGTTLQSGSFAFTASVTDANSANVSGSISVRITASIAGNFDGPAELPRVYVQSDLTNTPAPGSVISVPKGGDFQQASIEPNVATRSNFRLRRHTSGGSCCRREVAMTLTGSSFAQALLTALYHPRAPGFRPAMPE